MGRGCRILWGFPCKRPEGRGETLYHLRGILSIPQAAEGLWSQASGQDLRGQSPPGCPRCCFCHSSFSAPRASGLEKAPGRGQGTLQATRWEGVGLTPCPHPPRLHTPSPLSLHGPGRAQEPRDHCDPEVASCLGFPSCAACPHLALSKPDIFPENRESPYAHCGGPDGQGDTQALGGPSQASCPPPPPGFAGRSPVRPELSPVRASGGRRFQLL